MSDNLCIECTRLKKEKPNEAVPPNNTCAECLEVIGRDLERERSRPKVMESVVSIMQDHESTWKELAKH